jgi:Mce-associated membrane protein
VPKTSLRIRPESGGPGRRSLSAAARAAAKRAAQADDDRRDALLPPAAAGDAWAPGEVVPVPDGSPVPVADVVSAAGTDAGADIAAKAIAGPVVVVAPEKPDEPGAEDEDEDEDGGGARRAAGRAGARASAARRNSLLSAVLAVLVVVGVVVGTLLASAYRHGDSTQRARTQALSAARTAAPAILSYDYRHLDRDFAAALSHLTGPFRDEYRRTTSTVVAPTAKQYHGVVKATVAQPAGGEQAASVVSASPGKVVVLLFMNQLTTSTRLDTPRLDLNRVRMTLTHTADGWKISAVDAL